MFGCVCVTMTSKYDILPKTEMKYLHEGIVNLFLFTGERDTRVEEEYITLLSYRFIKFDQTILFTLMQKKIMLGTM